MCANAHVTWCFSTHAPRLLHTDEAGGGKDQF